MFLCFTDLDGTLLNHDDYRYDAAIPTIQTLKKLGIPVIPTTSKTKAEVLELREALGLKDPFIVENGSGIFLESDDPRFDFSALDLEMTTEATLTTITLGIAYAQARQSLQHLAQQIGEPLTGFGDLSLAALQDLTQLPLAALKQAGDRQFSEPFLRPQTDLGRLEFLATKAGLQILVGNRFCHLLGAGAGKGRAVQLLQQAWQQAHLDQAPIKTLGLGDSPNDLSLLEAMDVAIAVPGPQGVNPKLVSQIETKGWLVAPEPGAKGWARAVTAQLDISFD
ncbi:HAD-IIB family hydrolase [Picosynechococcus sp. PCC 11901]|uniref:HAD-IIB family hydrolase n=1 Tax=Picosynechococcus sp. PCC 11901 TaxID=2579791 RepID=UPI0010FBECEC|nr:HAD-IIB family hydrolase [Picosynechococcus sp. PCC 11901]QCS50520.1 HAD-IIB family hydrolase [Picosynechococcus sp. PCC 11901]